VSSNLSRGDCLPPEEIAHIARTLVSDGNHSQKEVAAAIGCDQSQVSRALSGETRYTKTCVDIIEHYAGVMIDYPVGCVSKINDDSRAE
jgi:transcriptional regulator with XRE-family HTH domain